MSYGPTPTTSAPASSSTKTSQSSPYCASGSYADAVKKRLSTSNRETKSLNPPTQLPQGVHQRSNSPSNISGRQVSACQPAATSQPSRYCASGSYADAARKRPSTSSRKNKPLTQPAQLPQGVHQPSNKSSNISGQQASAYQRSTPRTPHPEAKTPSPAAIKKEINSAYAILKNQNFVEAEEAFRVILQEYQGKLSPFNKHNTIMGLARALKEQTNEKQLEACSLLEALRLDGRCNKFGASIIHHLDLNLSLCEEALGWYFAAEKRLIKLRRKRTDADEKTLCKPSGFYAADITHARLLQSMGKHWLAETLLLKTKEELIEKLQSQPHTCAAQKLRKYFGNVNMALVRLWQLMEKHQLAEDLLLDMSGKHPDDAEDILCKPTRHEDINLALSVLWRLMGKYERAERLLLNMSNKRPDDSEDSLCSPSRHHDIDLALVRLWEVTDKHELAEKLLLFMIGKHPNDSVEVLCEPFGKASIDLALVRLWQIMGKYKQSSKLLLNMSGSRPGASEEEMCMPSGHCDLDLTRARFWQMEGRHDLTLRLLLNMSGKHPGASEEILCKPCWQQEIDLTLMRHWEVTGKYHLSERLLLNMSGKDPDDSEEILCKPCGNHDFDLALAMLWEMMDKPEWTEILLLNMSSKHFNDTEDNLCKPSGNHNVDLTLARFWQRIGKHEQAERLLQRGCKLYHSNEFENALLSHSAGQEGFLEKISHSPETVNTLLATSIHYFNLACEQIIDIGPESGQDNLHKALEFVESALKKYPPAAGAFSQKAHCLRMLGKDEQEWREWFDRAEAFDTSRAYRAKTHFWRSREAAALQKSSNLKE
ncbi:hypothetical protein [Endozoicomonas sp. 8E]|uniref:hypothetical protein n=1 Tax=Endozoicomonas sp. 8E TaxID=3035692 RepID=UPI0029393366|nr:hypothetical protein [Endozoicomonas sp. 8E]WOG26234.1 hypothetical protein P6910_16910 [Endozoicomonas sp. 8E]